MDPDENRRKRHQQHPPGSVYPVPNQQQFREATGQVQAPNPGQQQGRSSFAGSSSDRFRPAPIQTPSSTARGGGLGGGAGGAGGYGYYNEGASSSYSGGLPANPMQQNYSDYTPEQPQRPQQQQQPQSFGSYNPNMMYNVPQQAQPVYDAQFQPRQPAAMQMLSDVAAPSFFPGEPTNPAQAPAPVLHHQQVPSASSAVYSQNPADRTSLLQGYPNNMGNMGGIPQNAPPPRQEIMDEEAPAFANFTAAYDTYHAKMKEIFQNIRAGSLVEASQFLMDISDWLLPNVAELGLTSDDQNLHTDRIALWNEFNTAWLAILQKQKDMTLEFLETGRNPRHPQSLISIDYLEKMGKDLVRFCDGIEKFGLVDYQYGVGEENIMMILTECLDLLENDDDNNNNDAVVAAAAAGGVVNNSAGGANAGNMNIGGRPPP